MGLDAEGGGAKEAEKTGLRNEEDWRVGVRSQGGTTLAPPRFVHSSHHSVFLRQILIIPGSL